jgi:hypothetical protein
MGCWGAGWSSQEKVGFGVDEWEDLIYDTGSKAYRGELKVARQAKKRCFLCLAVRKRE